MYANLFLRAGLSLEIDRVAWGPVKFWKSLRMVVYSCSGQPVLVFQHIQNDLVYNVPSIVMSGLISFLFFHTLQTAFLKFMGFFSIYFSDQPTHLLPFWVSSGQDHPVRHRHSEQQN